MYNIAIYVYLFAVKVAALFSSKPAKMVKGHREVFDMLRKQIDRNAQYIWFHAASLGEFEQGRPLIERIRKEYPQYKDFHARRLVESVGHIIITYLLAQQASEVDDYNSDAKLFLKLAEAYIASAEAYINSSEGEDVSLINEVQEQY